MVSYLPLFSIPCYFLNFGVVTNVGAKIEVVRVEIQVCFGEGVSKVKRVIFRNWKVATQRRKEKNKEMD